MSKSSQKAHTKTCENLNSGLDKNSLQRGVSLKIQLVAGKCPVGKIFFLCWKKYFLNWKIIFFQLGNSECPFRGVFVYFRPFFCWFREVERKYADLKNIYIWRRCVTESNTRFLEKCSLPPFSTENIALEYNHVALANGYRHDSNRICPRKKVVTRRHNLYTL